MQFEGRRRSGQMPNLTPLIDLVFLLLIFFMLTSHFVQEQTIDIDLPTADSGKAIAEDEQLELVINAEGRFLLDEHFVEPENLEGLLREKLTSRQDRTLRIRGDLHAPLGQAVTVLDIARKAGASGVDVVTEQK
ncbi:MAG: biopolymer transporter ExbD [Gammaproteobacteria bacterium]|nr:biopolymer transporter ExbD [Gammaproteobacteria bacterium]